MSCKIPALGIEEQNDTKEYPTLSASEVYFYPRFYQICQLQELHKQIYNIYLAMGRIKVNLLVGCLGNKIK